MVRYVRDTLNDLLKDSSFREEYEVINMERKNTRKLLKSLIEARHKGGFDPDFEYVAYDEDGLLKATSSKGWKDLADQLGITPSAILQDRQRNGDEHFAKVAINFEDDVDDEDLEEVEEGCNKKRPSLKESLKLEEDAIIDEALGSKIESLHLGKNVEHDLDELIKLM